MKSTKKGDVFLCEDHVYSGHKGVVLLECIKAYKHERFARVMWAENENVKKAATSAWRGTYPNHHMRYTTKDGAKRVVRSVSAVQLRKQHWNKMKKLRGDELQRWKLMVDL
jgi:hypothetical protein